VPNQVKGGGLQYAPLGTRLVTGLGTYVEAAFKNY